MRTGRSAWCRSAAVASPAAASGAEAPLATSPNNHSIVTHQMLQASGASDTTGSFKIHRGRSDGYVVDHKAPGSSEVTMEAASAAVACSRITSPFTFLMFSSAKRLLFCHSKSSSA